MVLLGQKNSPVFQVVRPADIVRSTKLHSQGGLAHESGVVGPKLLLAASFDFDPIQQRAARTV